MRERIFFYSLMFTIAKKIHGNLWANLQHYWPLISHIQIASVPERHEPNKGEVNYPWLFQQLVIKIIQAGLDVNINPKMKHSQGWDGWEK